VFYFSFFQFLTESSSAVAVSVIADRTACSSAIG